MEKVNKERVRKIFVKIILIAVCVLLLNIIIEFSRKDAEQDKPMNKSCELLDLYCNDVLLERGITQTEVESIVEEVSEWETVICRTECGGEG